MRKWHWTALAFLTIVSVIVEFSMHQDPHHSYWWNSIPLFWIMFGFAGCAALVYFAKIILAPFIYKKEDYYHD